VLEQLERYKPPNRNKAVRRNLKTRLGEDEVSAVKISRIRSKTDDALSEEDVKRG
jgi:hypothetical protein